MRKAALLWLFLATLCGGILFHTASRVNDGLARLASIGAGAKKEDESLRVLQAEWSYLNQPERLEKLSKKYLGLEPLKGKQFGKASQLEDRPAEPVIEAAVMPAPEPVAKKVAEKPPVVILKPGAENISPVLSPSAAVRKQPGAKSAWREQPRMAGPRTAPPSLEDRDFTDVMKSLGVQ